jgi:DNA invertase Pin-like site-specific DNA recombinase
MRAIGYTRVSTEDQAQSGVSLQAQEEKIRAYCTAKGWELVTVVQDAGYSAKDLNRPGMQEVIRGCKGKEFDVVVILKLDRLTRSVNDLGYLVEDVFNRHAVAFSSIQDNFDTCTANGRMVMNILATLAQWERDVISERTREAMQFMKRGLKRVGAVPIGFDLEKEQLVPNRGEMGTARAMMRLRSKGASYQKIAEHLNRGKVAAKNGGKWHPKTVMGVVTHLDSLPGDHWVMRKYFTEKGDKGNEKGQDEGGGGRGEGAGQADCGRRNGGEACGQGGGGRGGDDTNHPAR